MTVINNNNSNGRKNNFMIQGGFHHLAEWFAFWLLGLPIPTGYLAVSHNSSRKIL
jgi:hypothetical protein